MSHQVWSVATAARRRVRLDDAIGRLEPVAGAEVRAPVREVHRRLAPRRVRPVDDPDQPAPFPEGVPRCGSRDAGTRRDRRRPVRHALDRRPPQRGPGCGGGDLDAIEGRVELEVADDGADVIVDRVDRDERGGHRRDPVRALVLGLRRVAAVDVGHQDRRRADLAAVLVGRNHAGHRDSVPASRRRTAASRPAVYRASVTSQPGRSHRLSTRRRVDAVRPDEVDAVDRGGDAALHPPGARDAPARTRGALDPGARCGIDGRVPGGSGHPRNLDLARAAGCDHRRTPQGGPPWTGRSRW